MNLTDNIPMENSGGSIVIEVKDDTCCICLDALDKHISVLPCNHQIHTKCYNHLLTSKGKKKICPICRAVIFEVPEEKKEVSRGSSNLTDDFLRNDLAGLSIFNNRYVDRGYIRTIPSEQISFYFSSSNIKNFLVCGDLDEMKTIREIREASTVAPKFFNKCLLASADLTRFCSIVLNASTLTNQDVSILQMVCKKVKMDFVKIYVKCGSLDLENFKFLISRKGVREYIKTHKIKLTKEQMEVFNVRSRCLVM